MLNRLTLFLVDMLDGFFVRMEMLGTIFLRFFLQGLRPTITGVCDATGIRPTRIAAMLLAGSVVLDTYNEATHASLSGAWAFNLALWLAMIGGGIYVVDLWTRALEKGLTDSVPSFVISFLRMHTFLMVPLIVSMAFVAAAAGMAVASKDPEGMWSLLQFAENMLDIGVIACTWTLHIPKGKKFSERVRDAFSSPALAPLGGRA